MEIASCEVGTAGVVVHP